jgi:hypothetical protein
MAVLINASTSTGLVQSADNSGEIELQSNGTTALKVNTNEGIQILNCLGVGNATPSTSGAGITFPATQSASSDANTLDDYEEGTWTPVVTFGGNSVGQSYSTQVGNYTKIGRQVFVQCFVNLSNKGSSTGDAYITGLPFTSSSSGSSNSGGSLVGYFNMTGITIPLIGISANESRLTLRTGTSTGDALMTHANFNPGLLVIVAQYFV